VRVNLALLFVIVGMFGGSPILGQSPNASLSGVVLDPDKKSIADAEILVVNDYTRVQYEARTNAEGFFAVTNLPPGQYRIQVSKPGFKAIIKPDIILNVQDALAIAFTLPIGASSVVVTVEGGVSMVNSQTAGLGTVVDHTYVENMPLNGRSFQDLIMLTPGVVTTSPQARASQGFGGEFSVNGQRTESNYYTVDGVSANLGIAPGSPSAPASSGSLPASTALGTTQGLVSVDALEQFRVQSSTYSAEYGRNPGGQFSFATRSGTNQWHGTAFDYLRNDVFDAKNWFNNYYSLAKPALRQNDFGGTVGGPILKNRLFFFASYEGLRAQQPQEATVSYVPDESLRQSAAPAVQPVLNAFPIANGPNLGNGLAEYIGTWSNPSAIDSFSLRVDDTVNQKLKLFFRFSYAPSSVSARKGGNSGTPSNPSSARYTTRTYTAGASGLFSNQIANDLRFNYSTNESSTEQTLDGFGGAQPLDFDQIQGIDPKTNPVSSVGAALSFLGYFSGIGQSKNTGSQRQFTVVDTLSISRGKQQYKFGVDYRRLTPEVIQGSPNLYYLFEDTASLETNSIGSLSSLAFAPAYPVYTNFSAFAEDEWHPVPRLNLSFGLRWEVNPAPGTTKGSLPYTVEGASPATLTLAAQGTPLWQTTWFNFAPRLGGAYILRDTPRRESVIRAGIGVFFDTGQQAGSYGYLGPGFGASRYIGADFGIPASFPVQLAVAVPAILNPPVPPYGSAYAFPTHLQLPYTLQWNVSFQQELGESQALTVSYVGSAGRRLLEQSLLRLTGNPNFSNVTSFQNGLTSDYDALQFQFQRRLHGGLTSLASYTYSHCIDYGSQNTAYPYVRGNCDFDVRHNMSGALSYDVPNAAKSGVLAALARNWGVDLRVSARTAFPITVNGPSLINPVTGQFESSGLDLVPGQPIYLYGSQYPGNRRINPAAFALPAGCTPLTCGTSGKRGDAPRNFLRGFNAWQADLAVRREFPIHDEVKFEFRAEVFNVLNHASFGSIETRYGNVQFGETTATLAQSLGVLSPLYQMGGPRSMQFAAKLLF